MRDTDPYGFGREKRYVFQISSNTGIPGDDHYRKPWKEVLNVSLLVVNVIDTLPSEAM